MNAPVRAPIPGDLILNAEIVVTSYFDTDGQMKYATSIQGDPNLAQAVGLLELAKISIYNTYMENEPYPPDDDKDGE